MTTDIVIPVWNQSDATIRCLESVAKNTSDYRVIIINNGSDAREVDAIRDALTRLEITNDWISFEDNRGFSVAINAGLRLSTSDPVILMNNDVTVPPRWLDKMRAHVARYRFSGIIGVLQDAGRINHYQRFYGDMLFPFEEVNAKPESIRKILHSCVPFSLVAMRREMIRHVGYLDEEFSPCLAEDDDYCDRARLAGWDTVLMTNILIHHDHRTSVKLIPDHEKIHKRNTNLYLAKRSARRIKK